MRRIIILFTISLYAVVLPQNSVKDNNSTKDSISTFRGLNLEINIPYKSNIQSFQSDFLLSKSLSQFAIDSASIWLATKTFFNQQVYYGFSSETFSGDILQPLRLHYESEKKLSTLRYVLGMAQAGTAGYLLYRHIKKYGFK